MSVLKHIKSRNANYSKVIDYLLFQHDESTGKMIKDNFGRGLLRDEFYMDEINCDPMSFDKEYERTNFLFHKNQSTRTLQLFASGSRKENYRTRMMHTQDRYHSGQVILFSRYMNRFSQPSSYNKKNRACFTNSFIIFLVATYRPPFCLSASGNP